MWDTAGQERFREPSLQYYRGAVGIILVYDVTEPRSFDNLAYWISRIRQNGDEAAEIILIGNKIDMINDILVDQEQAAQLAQQHNITYYQTSAKDATNLDIAFKNLLTLIIQNPALSEQIDFKNNIKIGLTRPRKK